MTLTKIRRAGISANARDRVSVLDYIPVAQHAAIRAGTSTYDATSAIQAAITDTAPNPDEARAVFFPAGKYLCESGLTLLTGTKLIGEALEKTEHFVHKGTGTVIQFGSGGITAVQQNKIEFYNITIRTESDYTDQYVVKFDAVYACRFHNIVISHQGTHASATGLYMDSDDGDPSTADYAWSNFFDNCLFTTPRGTATTSGGHTIEFYGSDSWFNNIYSSGGKGVLTKPGGNNWSNIHCEHSHSGAAKSATGTNAGFTVKVDSYTGADTKKIINVSNLYCDLNDIAVKWESNGTAALHQMFNFSNVITRNNENCDFLITNSGSGASAFGGSIVNYHSKGAPSTPIKTSGTVTKPYVSTEGSSLTDIKIGIETGSPNVLLDVGGSSTGGLAGLTQSTFYTGLENNTNWGGVVMGSGPNGNSPFVAASKTSDGTALPLALYTNGTKRVYIRNDQAGIAFGSDTAAANTLDDYEEGTWTPSISGRTITTATGQYTKIGRLVIARFGIADINSSITSPSISGLPVASMGVTQIGICQVGDIRGVTYSTDYSNIYGRVDANSSSIEFMEQKTDGSNHGTGLSFATNVIIRGFVMYFAA